MENKTLLITGGTGSFGVPFVKAALRYSHIRHIRVYSRDEHKQLAMKDAIGSDRVSYFVGDIRDSHRLSRVMEGVDWVVAAAALKQAPLGEVYGSEFAKTNIEGSSNTIDACLDNRVERCLFISTDKAVEPINLYGATKMVAEKLFVQADRHRGQHRTRFACTRYGNVASSRSTLVPILLSLPDDAPSPVTEPEATRFWITLPNANQFVLDTLHAMEGGRIYFPRLKSVRVIDVVEALRPGKPIKYIGHREGDKLHEVLTVDGERYSSGDNELMTIDEIRRDCGISIPTAA